MSERGALRHKKNTKRVKYDAQVRYDVLITAQNAGYRMSEQAAKGLILNLKTKYWIRPTEECIEDDWVEVYCDPEPSSSEMFTPGAFDRDVPVFLEAVVRFGQEPATLEYGPKRVFFYIEFRGCLFKEPLGSFKNFFKKVMGVRAAIAHRTHTELPPRPSEAQEASE